MRRPGLSPADPIISSASYVRYLNFEIFQVVKSFLLKLYLGKAKSEGIVLEDLFSFIQPGIFGPPNFGGFDRLENIISADSALLGVARFEGQRYLLSCVYVQDRMQRCFALILSGDPSEDFRPPIFAEALLKEALRNSGYLGKIIRFQNPEIHHGTSLKTIREPEVTLDGIYMNDKKELEDFVSAVARGDGGLKYLFVGEPGTGKTETIRALISECSRANRELTVFLIDAACGVHLSEVFEFAEVFRPIMVCIDDIDLIVGSRERLPAKYATVELSRALQELDGFLSRDGFFFVATTNDRRLVDLALRRPGRVDFIMEFGPLAPQFYSSLVLAKTGDRRLAELFEKPEVKEKLSRLEATGAFLVNLTKYLLRPRYEVERYNLSFVLKTVEHLHSIFRTELGGGEKMGFVP